MLTFLTTPAPWNIVLDRQGRFFFRGVTAVMSVKRQMREERGLLGLLTQPPSKLDRISSSPSLGASLPPLQHRGRSRRCRYLSRRGCHPSCWGYHLRHLAMETAAPIPSATPPRPRSHRKSSLSRASSLLKPPHLLRSKSREMVSWAVSSTCQRDQRDQQTGQ